MNTLKTTNFIVSPYKVFFDVINPSQLFEATTLKDDEVIEKEEIL